MRFTVDPWDPSYGSSVDPEFGASPAATDTTVEVPDERWARSRSSPACSRPTPCCSSTASAVSRPRSGVHEGDGLVAPGLCASYAAGVVCCCASDGAHLAAFEVRRSLVTAARDAEKIVTWAGTYDIVGARPGAAPAQFLSAALQGDLAKVEAEVAGRARGVAVGADDLLVLDGQLQGPHPLPRAIGFVKSHNKTYLDGRLGGVVGDLSAGERTPVFRIERPFPVYSCYLRLPGASPAPWAGVARVECGGELTPAAAVALADLAQVTLVRYASAEYKDSRAPQNLYPIAGLERGLRRRLGEPALLYRALRAAAA